jgi:hypothetical protein
MSVFSFPVFVLLQIAFLPLALVGVLLVAYKQMVVSKRLGVSQTAIEVLNGRWTMHVFDIRRDQAAAQLAGIVPNTSTFGLWLVLFPLWVKHKMSGTYFGYPRTLLSRGRSTSTGSLSVWSATWSNSSYWAQDLTHAHTAR